MTFSPMMSAAVSDQGTGPSQPEPESVTRGADYGEQPGQEETGPQDGQDVAWPHQSYLELGSLPTAAPCARLHATLVLWEWELGRLAHTAGLVVSELVSNAVAASAARTEAAGGPVPGQAVITAHTTFPLDFSGV